MARYRFDIIWDRICRLHGRQFKTKTGKPFEYSVESETTVWVQRDGHRINQSLAKSNFAQVYSYMKTKPIAGPGDINKIAIKRRHSQVRGPSYVWAILHDKRIIS